MDTQTRVFVTLFIIVGLIAGLYLFSDWFSRTTGYALGEDQKIAFAECLASKKAILYITSNCADCDKQREILGENAYSKIDKIECGSEFKCTGLTSLPAWEIENKFYYGVKDFNELDQSSSCDINLKTSK